ncbi:hypothetical protein TIFTF001_023485 [Ficus carica]|uniref:Uncharacterized protein n=1 Tax=Ficus carica TaxID=3494 RepID=A0AA88DK69_FICCA|nr:hypothetical protein TIFTF001_023485 [Ficus carica]
MVSTPAATPRTFGQLILHSLHRELMDGDPKEALEEVDPKRVLRDAFCVTESEGSSTACVVSHKDGVLDAASIGDSSHYERPRSVQWDVSIYLSLDSKWEQTCHGKEEGRNKHTWRAQYNGELYAAFGKDESLPKRNLLILSQLVGP